MKYLIIISLSLSCNLISCNQSKEVENIEPQIIRDTIYQVVEKKAELTETEIKAQLEKMELKYPLKYVSLDYYNTEVKLRKVSSSTIFKSAKYAKDGLILKGTISSNASLASYQDVELTVEYLSQTGTVINKNSQRIYDYFYPGTSTDFEIEIPFVKDSKTITAKITKVAPISTVPEEK